MKYPTNADEWWANVDAAWSDILDIFSRCDAPLSRGPEGCVYSDGPGQDATIHDKTLIRVLEDAREQRDEETLHRWLELCWEAAPDARRIHDWPNWGTLCDLCSEYNPCFFPEEDEEEPAE